MDEFDSSQDGCGAPDSRLAAFLDDELSLCERREVEAHIRACPRCAADLAQERLARTVLRNAASRLAAPDYLRGRVQAALLEAAVRRPARWRMLSLAGMAAAIAVIGILGLFLLALHQVPSEALMQRVATAHRNETLSVTPVSYASTDGGAIANWLQQQAGRRVEVPSLDRAGFHLTGARLDPSVAPGAVTLVYEDGGIRLTCTILPSLSPAWVSVPLLVLSPSVQTATVQGASVAAWLERDGTYIMVADLDPAAVTGLARQAIGSAAG